MNLNTVLVALSVVMLIIGIHQSLLYGFFESYWLFMGSGLFFLWYQFRKNRLEHLKGNTPPSKTKKKKKTKKR